MKKNRFLLLFAMLCFAGKSQSQVLPCYSDQVRKTLIAAHPEVLQYEKQLEDEINAKLKNIDYSKYARTTTRVDETDSLNFWYDIPIVVHVIHDYGAEYLSDDAIFNDLKDWNIVYAKENSDTASVIAPFKGFIPNSNQRYIGNPHIRLHLATIDPYGNPTKGITRHRSYLTYSAGEPAKLDDWPPTSYVNIWSVNLIPASGGFQAAAYAFQPGGAAANPFGDGILCDFDYMQNSPYTAGLVGKTINHEMGHVFNLSHPWGNNNNPQVVLGDDNVDDTPPTWGHNPVGCITTPSSDDNSLYDTLYATNFFEIYPGSRGDSLVDYPDTTNGQNIMDYTYCSRMFTFGQCQRMHAALNSDIAGRSNLWNPYNLMATGVLTPDSTLTPLPDVKPIADFSATLLTGSTSSTNYTTRVNYFTFPNVGIKFINESYNDTLTNLLWTFNTATTSQTSTRLTADTLKFTEGGWVNLSMKATGNNTGDSTIDFPRAVFVSDPTATPADGYYQEFNGSDTAKWPMFNYYNNGFMWQRANVGYYDNSSVEYTGFDTRIDPLYGTYPVTGTPGGDFDDLFSIAVDLTSFGSGTSCFLNYFYSGASRSASSAGITDEMDIDYGIKAANGTITWTNLVKQTKGNLDNKGQKQLAYTPASTADWSPMDVPIPAAARTSYTVFRFRYKPGNAVTTSGTYSGGNNFYMDRIFFAGWPAVVNTANMSNVDVAVAPNPTTGDAYVVVKDADNTTAVVTVTDVTGKVVYKTSQQVTSNEARIQIPHAAISVQGMYIVQTVTGNQTHTQKLIVE